MTAPIVIPITGSVDPALLTGLAQLKQGMDGAGTAAESAGQKAVAAESGWSRSIDTLRRSAQAFNELRGAAASVVGGLVGAADRVAALVTEETRLRDTSRRLGLDFDQASAATGRFASSTDAMNAAGRFAAAGIRLTQVELDAVMRTAGAASEMLGTTATEEVQRLQDALVQGEMGGLRRFGAGLAAVAGESHSTNERLAALVTQARHTVVAADNASDSMARYRDALDAAKRAAALAFVDEAARLQAVSAAAHDATDGTDDLRVKMEAVGSTTAYVLTQIGNVAQVVVGLVGAALSPMLTALDVATAGLAALSSDGPRAAARAMAEAGQSGRFTQALSFARDGARGFANAYNASNEPRTSAAAPATPSSAAQADARAADAAARGGDMVFSNDEATQILGRNRGSGGTRQTAEQRAQARLASEAGARAMVASIEADRIERGARDVAVAEEEANAERDARADAESKRAEQRRLDELANAQALAENEKAILEQRAREHETFTGRIAETYNTQASAAQGAAELSSKAFEGFGKAFTQHTLAVINGSESVGQALQGMLSDTLASIAQEAAVKGAFEIAQGIGAAAGIVTAGLAPGHFAAGAAYLGVAALAGAGSVALAPSAPSAPAAAPRAGGLLSDRSSSSSDAMAPINITYNAPVFGGREGTDAEVGTRLDRYSDIARARRQRAA